ncbi:hypothetical protein TNIN_249781 [Trichonephila inaurata madagascariensis]|uniref:Uncharacterized protein n=1 Tax=Trichonephila inaurata madagascariensis TaxID=2747483 RepID=A0A8X6MG36_9ARAC|nr:hypothetical protein TNIN_249781 [Trichonephila inaurata madagascariensis]
MSKTNYRRFTCLDTETVTLELVTHPPAMSSVTAWVDIMGLPSTTQDTSTGGLLDPVVQERVMDSPTRTSFGPAMVTLVGATRKRNITVLAI